MGQTSKDEQAYESYKAFCSRVGVAPLSFDQWIGMTSEEEADTDA